MSRDLLRDLFVKHFVFIIPNTSTVATGVYPSLRSLSVSKNEELCSPFRINTLDLYDSKQGGELRSVLWLQPRTFFNYSEIIIHCLIFSASSKAEYLLSPTRFPNQRLQWELNDILINTMCKSLCSCPAGNELRGSVRVYGGGFNDPTINCPTYWTSDTAA